MKTGFEEIDVGRGHVTRCRRKRRSNRARRRSVASPVPMGLGDAGDELASYVDLSLLPAPTPCYPMSGNSRLPRCVKWGDIITTDEALEYARRFFRGAVTHAKRHRRGTPIYAIWADAARLYVESHNDAKDGVKLADVREKLARADQKSATALALERKQGGGSGTSRSPRPSDSGRDPLPDLPPPAFPDSVRQASLGPLAIAAAAAGAGLLAYVLLGRGNRELVDEEEFEEEFY